MLKDEPITNLINATHTVLAEGIKKGISQEIPAELSAALEYNAFAFSGFKTYHEMNQAAALLKDEKGGIKSFEKFSRDCDKIDATYNKNYLRAEYNFATQSAQMAAKWHDYKKDGDKYYLQYRTANDDKVRSDHAVLHNTTLPFNDPFWDEYYPPLGWNCRCTVVQVNKDKYPLSDSKKAIAAGEKATSKPSEKIFRFNAGKQNKIFPRKHPYFPKGCGDCNDGIKLAYNPNKLACQVCHVIKEIPQKDVVAKFKQLESAKNNEYINILKEIVHMKGFAPVEGCKKVFSMATVDADFKNLKAAALKAESLGYMVYIMPNPNGVRSFDFIFARKGALMAYDLKTITGKNSVGNRLNESIGQTRRVLLNMCVEYKSRNLSKEIKGYFEVYKDAQEVLIFKGKREISISRKDALDASFEKDFVKKYHTHK